MKNKIGVIQGRLLPKYKGLYQAHPKGYWQDEFILAKELGLDCIEFILDFNDSEENPLLTSSGVSEIMGLSKRYGVRIDTICADYFMTAPLHSIDKNVSLVSHKVILKLLESSYTLGVSDIVIPCVDQSSLNTQESQDRFVKALSKVVPIAEKYKINLSLETDLSPKAFINLLNRFNTNIVTVNYDIGNSASLGYDPVEELNSYGHKISDIHIKDRLLGGGSVPLGEGNADFSMFFNKLKEFSYMGPFIMQAYRDEEGVKLFKKQFNWIKSFLI